MTQDVLPSPEASAPKSTSPRIWKTGTLTYTAGGLTMLFVWLLWGDFAWSLKDRSVGPAMQIMLKKFEAADWLTGLLVGTLPPAIAMIFCPIISYYSDGHRSRRGRRIPFLLTLAPITAIAMVGLGFSPMLGARLHQLLGPHSIGLNGCTLVLFSLFWTLFDFGSVMANILFLALINDVVPTNILGRFFGAFRILGLLTGILFNYWLLGKVETYFLEIFLVIGAVVGVGFLTMCIKVKEGEYPPVPERKPGGMLQGLIRASESYLKGCFGHSYYLFVFIILSVPALALLPVNLFAIFFAKSVNMDMDTMGKWNAAMLVISLVLAYPIGMLADKFHPLCIGMIVLGLFGLVTLWGGLCIHDASSFTVAYVATGVLAGAWHTATASLPQRLFPKQKFSEYLSATSSVNCLAQILLCPALGAFLDHTGHVYRYTYLAAFLFAVPCMAVSLVVHRRFMAFGGPKGYVAP